MNQILYHSEMILWGICIRSKGVDQTFFNFSFQFTNPFIQARTQTLTGMRKPFLFCSSPYSPQGFCEGLVQSRCSTDKYWLNEFISCFGILEKCTHGLTLFSGSGHGFPPSPESELCNWSRECDRRTLCTVAQGSKKPRKKGSKGPLV